MPDECGVILGQSSLEEIVLTISVSTRCEGFDIFNVTTVSAPVAWTAMVPAFVELNIGRDFSNNRQFALHGTFLHARAGAHIVACFDLGLASA